MDVGVYVTELLKRLDEVCLSGIGTFSKKRTSAYFDNKQGIFFPPSQEYTFDSEKLSSQGELINYVCEVRNISEPSARYFIEKYTDTIKQSLQIKGYAVIDSLGKLRTANGSYVFEPNPIEDNSSSYGLIPVMETERKARKNSEPDLSAIRFKAQAQAAPAAPIAAQDPEQTVSADLKPKEEKSYKTAILIVITFLALGAAIVAGYFFFPHIFRPQDKNKPVVPTTTGPVSPAKPSEVKTKDTLSPEDKALKEEESKADSSLEKSLAILSQEKGISYEKARDTINTIITTQSRSSKKEVSKNRDTVATTIPVNTLTKYEIITGSFHLKSEAETYIAQLRKKGIDATIILDTKKPKYKVSMGSFTNKEAAHKEKRRIQAEIAKSAWVLTIKHN